MAFQPINFLNAPEAESPYKDLVGTLMRGYELGMKPQTLQNEMLSKKALADLNAQKAKFYEPELASKINYQGASAQHQLKDVERMNRELENPYWNKVPSGVGNLPAHIRMLQQTDPENPLIGDLKQAWADQRKNQEQQQIYRQTLIDTAPKRASTALGKGIIEQHEEIGKGYVPGTNKSVKATPEEQKAYNDAYENDRIKSISDPATRARAINGKNLKITLDGIDRKALFQYSGIPGSAKLQYEKFQSGLGHPSEAFTKYNKNLTLVQAAAKQLRQAMGDSVTPAAAAAIEHLLNPTSWSTDPKVAEEQFNTYVKTLDTEMDTFTNAISHPDVYKKEKPKQGSFESEVQLMMKQVPTWSEEKVRKVLREHRNG